MPKGRSIGFGRTKPLKESPVITKLSTERLQRCVNSLRGDDGRKYPWGNDWRPNAANAGDSSAQRLMNVGSYPSGKSSAGVMDLIGNAWEWTSSDVVVYPGGSLSSPVPQDVKVIRGGSWQPSNEATSTYRGYLHKTIAKDYSATGFRCVKDIGPLPAAATSQR